ncbi:unnamed protein product [Brachionus calyciflorus]|uniref:Uncharacterized protein n=1 Tax=Brachionus calyciflorus TaxID=104777 RepID=A0A814CJK7_9BILA|nr:unnamed protein product [Brachionus calyciflorus]
MDITSKIGTDILINLPIESLKVVIQKQQEELGKAFILREKQIIEVISVEFETWFTATSALKAESPKKIFTDLIALESKMVSGVIKVEPENQATTSRNNLNGIEQNIVKMSRLRDVPPFSGSNDGYIDECLYLVENGSKIFGTLLEDLVSEVIPFLKGSVLQTTIQLKNANANLS